MKALFTRILILAALFASTNIYAEVNDEKSDFFVKSFQSALEAKDIGALREHVYWEGVEANVRQLIEMSLNDMLSRRIKSTEVVPVDKDAIFEFERDGVVYVTNLNPIGYLRVNFDVPESESQKPGIIYIEDATFPIGEHNGRYMITTTVRKN